MFNAFPVILTITLSLTIFLLLLRFVFLRPLLSFAKARANRALDIENYNKNTDYSLPGFLPIHKEVTLAEVTIEGEIPKDLRGLYLRNGTNSLYTDNDSRRHMFNGSGMVHQINIEDGSARYTNCYNQTPRHKAEKSAGKELYVEFGDVAGGGKPALSKALITMLQQRFDFIPTLDNLKNNGASTAIQYHHGKLYALTDGNYPFALYPRMEDGWLFFDGSGEHDNFDGRLQQPFTAHPKIDPETGDWFSFGNDSIKSQTVFYDVLSQGVLTRHEKVMRQIPAPSFVHDSNITEHYAIVPDLSIKTDINGLKAPHKSMVRFDVNHNIRFGVITRDFKEGDSVQWFITKAPGHIWHTVNAWEEKRSDGGTDIVLFTPVFRDYAPSVPIHSSQETPAKLYKFRFNLDSGEVTEERLLLDHFYERPTLNPRYVGKPSRYAYLLDEGGAGGIMGKGVLKYDLIDEKEVKYFDYGDYRGGEAIFVAKTNNTAEDDGYLLDLLMTEDKAYLVIIDAATMEEKAKLHLPQRVPYGVHSCWLNLAQMDSLSR